MRLKTLLEVSAERVALLMGGSKEEQVNIIMSGIIIRSAGLLLPELIWALVASNAPPRP